MHAIKKQAFQPGRKVSGLENGRARRLLKAFITILKDNWQWRKQIGRLAVFELVKKSRGAKLSWMWLFIRPAIYIFVFWFTLDIGLRVGQNMVPPYFIWLISGLIPWFFMQEMLAAGSDILHRYSYLVTKIKFPISGIPTIFGVSSLIVHLGLIIILFAIYFIMGMPLDIYLIQVPFIIIIMFFFFTINSHLMSLVSAISKDFANLMKALITPLFWLSGILYDPLLLNIEWIRIILLFNPITFIATAFRSAFYAKTWIWDSFQMLAAFAGLFIVTIVITLIIHRRLSKEVPDVL